MRCTTAANLSFYILTMGKYLKKFRFIVCVVAIIDTHRCFTVKKHRYSMVLTSKYLAH